MSGAFFVDGWHTDRHEHESKADQRATRNLPRGVAIVTDAGDLWVHEDVDPEIDRFGNEVTTEGVAVGLDRRVLIGLAKSSFETQSAN